VTPTAEEEEEQSPDNTKVAVGNTRVQWDHPALVGDGLWQFFLKQTALKTAFISSLPLFFNV